MKSPLRFLLLLAFAALPSVGARACQVPVYRYALEQWPASFFRVTVFHRGALTADQKEAFDWLPKKPTNSRKKSAVADQVNIGVPVNIAVQDVDLEAPDPVGAGLWSTLGNPELPWVVVQFPFEDQIMDVAWSGKLDRDTIKNLVDSPARRELARRLLRGDSAVWLLVQKENANGAKAIATVEAELKKLEKTLKLPPPEKDGFEAQVQPTESLKIPLKVGFSTILIRDNDPAEKIFLQILQKATHRPAPTDAEVVAYPVFGRGRCLGPQTGEDLKPEAIEKACSYLIGPCSCQIKGQNPGVDLPMLVKWDEFIKGSVTASKALPPLTSLMPVAPPVETASGMAAPVAPKATPAAAPAERQPRQPQIPASQKIISLKQSVIAVLGVAVILVSGFGFFLWRKRG